LGTDREGVRVVIKATRDTAGKEEIQHERTCRQKLHQLNFAYQPFYSPAERDYFTAHNYLVSIQLFIEQPSSFLERTLEEQFRYALHAFKIQEGAHATTKKHYRSITRVFGVRTSQNYLTLHEQFKNLVQTKLPDTEIIKSYQRVTEQLTEHQQRIDQYSGFLTHTDFVPHNFRINDNKLYLLDFSSLLFGNKHESWARFLNFMTLYNHELEKLLIEYVEANRAPEERESLQLMRIYRLTEIIAYYANTLDASTGTLSELNRARINFWHDTLQAELHNERVARGTVTAYTTLRDQLRSDEEKERQLGLH
jgi:hypothetical protein